ncbi:hypothetical protein GCM10010231_13290 [Streptomyces sindenensis]|nr:hypothetical protein GCM10010231_13290 [Streptomyces sindenensis]
MGGSFSARPVLVRRSRYVGKDVLALATLPGPAHPGIPGAADRASRGATAVPPVTAVRLSPSVAARSPSRGRPDVPLRGLANR